MRAGQAERVGVLTCGVAALVADQVDLNEPRHRVVPVRPGPDRDLAFQQRPRLGVAAALELARAPFRRQAAVDGGADMPTSSVAVCSSMSSSPYRRSTDTSSPSCGASRLAAGIPSTAQQNYSAATTFGPYFGGRGDLDRANFGRRATRNALRA